MFKALARAAGRLLSGAASMLGFSPEEKTPEELLSYRDRFRQMTAFGDFEVKRKLGRSFFCRRLSPRTRAARIRSLTRAERLRAVQLGWLPESVIGGRY